MKTLRTPTKKKLIAEKIISIQLFKEDVELLQKISEQYGLIKHSDCLRLAIRETARNIEDRIMA